MAGFLTENNTLRIKVCATYTDIFRLIGQKVTFRSRSWSLHWLNYSTYTFNKKISLSLHYSLLYLSPEKRRTYLLPRGRPHVSSWSQKLLLFFPILRFIEIIMYTQDFYHIFQTREDRSNSCYGYEFDSGLAHLNLKNFSKDTPNRTKYFFSSWYFKLRRKRYFLMSFSNISSLRNALEILSILLSMFSLLKYLKGKNMKDFRRIFLSKFEPFAVLQASYQFSGKSRLVLNVFV